MSSTELTAIVAAHVRDVQDFPEPGVLFKDFTPLLGNHDALQAVVDDVVERFGGKVDAVAGIEARGFMFGAAAAVALGVGFVPVRKAGKLPRATYTAKYELEYGTAALEMHQDAMAPGARVLVMDDVLATGGTAAAACSLVERAGATVIGFDTIVEIEALHGREKVSTYPVHSLLVV